MNKKTLTSLFAEAIYRIPDYQRGYAWEEKQWKDFIQDIDALVDENVMSHYTGTVVVYAARDAEVRDYGTKRLKVIDVVDGQQRLTTSCLYLSVILRALQMKGEAAFEREIPDFLYSDATCKLILNNDTADTFYDLLKSGRANTAAQFPHEERLIAATKRLRGHVDEQIAIRGEAGLAYLKELFHALTQKLHFTFYAIEEECEIGMTFELMNSRGKDLSVLELLKNYLMHWISRNELIPAERKNLTAIINKTWKDTYSNLGACDGDEDQCLRIAWTLYCNHTPANWNGYDGFKESEYIPLRNFTAKRPKEEVKAFLIHFADGLAGMSSHYAAIISPKGHTSESQEELLWLTKIHHTGNIANFLPLMVAARTLRVLGRVDEANYIALLKSLECFAYRVFLFNGKRSNAGKSSFYRWAHELFHGQVPLPDITAKVHDLTRYYATDESFAEGNSRLDNWYNTRHLVKYTLFEYEVYLLMVEGKGKQPHLAWEQLNDSTIEHILPQHPKADSHWLEAWTSEDFDKCLHDIANLVLTQNNSNYLNFEFERKKGKAGESPSYSNSDIRQERRLARYADWIRATLDERKKELESWISDRWRAGAGLVTADLDVIEDEDEDQLDSKKELSAQ